MVEICFHVAFNNFSVIAGLCLDVIGTSMLMLLKGQGRKCSFSVGVHDLRYLYAKYEPQHYKTNKVTVRPAKTQISLGIHPVWSVFAVHSMGS